MKKFYYLRKFLDYLGVSLILGVLYFLWVLYRGPLAVPFLKPYIVQALNSDQNEYSVSIGSVNLELVRSIQPVKIIANNVVFKKNDENFKINAPKLSLSFNVRALLGGVIAPSNINIENPTVSVFTVYGIEKENKNEINKKKLQYYFEGFEEFLKRYNDKNNKYLESYINKISIKDADIEFHEVDLGRRFLFKDVNFDFDRHLTDLQLSASGMADLKDRLATLAMRANYEVLDDKLILEFDGADIVLSDFLDEFNAGLPQIDVPVNAKLKADINFGELLKHKQDLVQSLDTVLEKITFDIQGQKGNISFDKNKEFDYAVDAFALEGAINGGLNSVEIKNADLNLGEQKIKLGLKVLGYKNYFFEQSLKDLKIVLTADVAKLALNDLSLFWPKYMSETAWAWCKENMRDGNFENAKFVFELKYDEKTNSMFLSDLKGNVELRDATISYLEDMPDVQHVNGSAVFSPTSIDIKISDGVADGVKIKGGQVLLYDLVKYNNYIKIDLKCDAAVQDALTFINHKPLMYADEYGLKPESVSGNVAIDLKLDFELYKDLKPEEIKVDVKADLQNVIYQNILEGKNLKADKLLLTIKDNHLKAGGDAVLDDIKVNFEFLQDFSGNQTRSTGAFKFKYDDLLKKKLGLKISLLDQPYLTGDALVRADLDIKPNGKTTMNVLADLKNMAIDYAFLGFVKAKNEEGSLEAKIDLDGNKIKSVSSVALKKKDFNMNGAVLFDAKGEIKTVDVKSIKGPKTSAVAKLDVLPNNKFKMNVSGNSYDLSELFAKVDNVETKKIENDLVEDNLKNLPNAEMFIAVNSLWTNPDTPIKNFAGSVVSKTGVGIEEAHIVGNYGSDKSIKLNLDYVPRANGEYLLNIDSNNAGSTLRVLRFYENMYGGILKIEAKKDKDGKFVGHAQVRDFSIKNTPILAKLLSVASLSGIVDMLRGEGLTFSHFDAPFIYQNKTLDLSDVKMFGNVIGLTGEGTYNRLKNEIDFKGTISPAYSINSFLGKIPVVGSLLVGKKNGTVIALSYDIKGEIEDPKISINPLSVLSPNSIKDIFTGKK